MLIDRGSRIHSWNGLFHLFIRTTAWSTSQPNYAPVLVAVAILLGQLAHSLLGLAWLVQIVCDCWMPEIIMSDPERHSLSPKLSSVAENEIENRFHKLIVPSAPSKQETHEQKQRGSSLSGAQSPDDIGISEYRYMPHRDYYPDVPEYHRGFDGQEKVNSGKPQAQIRHDDFKNKEANPGKLQAGTWARRSKGYKEINPGDLQAENVENAARLPAPRTKNTNVIRPWRTRSKRSMSVGADVGNERDDAEQTSGGDISENPGRERRHTKRRKNIVKLETEESFDGDIAPEYDTGSLTDVLVNAADNNMEESILGLKPDEPNSSEPINPYAGSASIDKFPSPHLYSDYRGDLTEQGWEDIRAKLPADWRWDMKYTTTIGGNGKQHACITCMPMGSDEPKEFPLTIANLPVVLPVKYRWPLVAGVYPPPDPRASTPIDCRAKISLEVVRDLFLTFEHSIGFYILINGLLQVIVDWDFDIGWASSHLPNEYGGLEVCYIRHRMEPTMLQPPVKPKTAHPGTGGSLIQSLQLNDLIEARPRSLFKGKGSEGRIGLKVQRGGDPYLIMSTHVITDAILAKSPIAKITGRDKVEKLKGDWNEHVEIWAQNDKVCSFVPSILCWLTDRPGWNYQSFFR